MLPNLSTFHSYQISYFLALNHKSLKTYQLISSHEKYSNHRISIEKVFLAFVAVPLML